MILQFKGKKYFRFFSLSFFHFHSQSILNWVCENRSFYKRKKKNDFIHKMKNIVRLFVILREFFSAWQQVIDTVPGKKKYKFSKTNRTFFFFPFLFRSHFRVSHFHILFAAIVDLCLCIRSLVRAYIYDFYPLFRGKSNENFIHTTIHPIDNTTHENQTWDNFLSLSNRNYSRTIIAESNSQMVFCRIIT